MKRAIYPLYALADEGSVRPILDRLKQKGVTVRDGRAAPGKEDALVLFLSRNIAGDGPEADAFFRLREGRALIIPVGLDGSRPPEELQNALLARHVLDGTRYEAEELATLIAKAAQGEGTNRLPLVLSMLAAAILLVVGGIVLWRNRPRQTAEVPAGPDTPTPAPTATPAPTPAPAMPDFGADPSEVIEIVYIGDTFRHYVLSDGGYRMSGEKEEARRYQEVAYESRENNVLRFYSTETGQEIAMGELGDISYLAYLPNLRYLTFANVRGTLPDLSGLSKLKGVAMINCDIPDVAGLAGSGMKWFEYEGASVKSFSALNSCTDLDDAIFRIQNGGTRVDFSDFHPGKLYSMELDGGPAVDDLSGLAQCTHLQRLHLSSMSMTDLSFLKGLDLVELSLDSFERLTSLAGLEDMWTLIRLNIQNCYRLRDISALAGCNSLNEIGIHANDGRMNDLVDVSVLGKLTRLKSIGLNGVNIRDLDFLQGLPNTTRLDLGFSIARGADFSGLAAVGSFASLTISADGDYSRIGPFIQDKIVEDLHIWDGGLVDLSTLPKMTAGSTLELGNCLNRDLTGIARLPINNLRIKHCPFFASFDGIQNLPYLGRAGSNLDVCNCPRLYDWSKIEQPTAIERLKSGNEYARLSITGTLTLPDFTKFTFCELALEDLPQDVLPDLSCLKGINDSQNYSLRFAGMDWLTDLSPLFPLRGNRLEVPPQLGEQAQGLVEDGRFREFQIVFPDGGWDPNDLNVQLMGLEELDTLPPSILKHVKRLVLVGDVLVNDEATNYQGDWGDWHNNMPTAVLTDRATGEETRIRQAGTRFTDLARLSMLTGLEELTLWYQPLTSLEGVQALENLERLKVMFCPKLADVSAAFTMQGLKEINFECCPVRSLQGVQNLFALEQLEVCNTKITSLEGIEGLKRLRQVRIAGTDVKDFSPLMAVDFSYAAEHGGVSLALNVMHSRQLRSDAFAFLADIPAFDSLEMHDIPVDIWLDCVMDKPIRELHAESVGMTQEQFDAFVAAHPDLEGLQIGWNTGITDMSALLGLERLQWLQLSRDMEQAIASLGEWYGFELVTEN